MVLYYIILYCIVWYYIILYVILLYGIIWYYIILYCIILYYILLYCIIFYFILLQYIILWYIILFYSFFMLWFINYIYIYKFPYNYTYVYVYVCVCESCFSQVPTIHIIRALPSATSSSTASARFCQEESASWRTKRRTRGSSAMSARNFGGKSLQRNMEKLWVQ